MLQSDLAIQVDIFMVCEMKDANTSVCWGQPPDLSLAPGRRAATTAGPAATRPSALPPLLPSPPPLPVAPFSVPAQEAPAQHNHIRWPEGSTQSVLQQDETVVIRGVPRYLPAGTEVVTVPAAVRLMEGPGASTLPQDEPAQHRRSRSRSRGNNEVASPITPSPAPDQSRSSENQPRPTILLSKCREVARAISVALGHPDDTSSLSHRDFPEAWCASFAERTTHEDLDNLCRDTLSNYEYVLLIGTRATRREKLMALWRWVVGTPEV